MAFEIKKIKSGVSVNEIGHALQNKISQSRFIADVSFHENKLKIHQVRLRKSKDYCGNHPFACPVRPGGHKPHVHSSCLEGADWVAWNDMLNDVLDALGVAANVASSLCIIRKGEFRRIEYTGHLLGNGIDSEWDKDSEFYLNHTLCTTPVPSKFPMGTPGIYKWRANQ